MTDETKHILFSKTFWLNAVTIGFAFAGLLPQKYAVPVLAALNIGLRLVSSGSVTVLK